MENEIKANPCDKYDLELKHVLNDEVVDVNLKKNSICFDKSNREKIVNQRHHNNVEIFENAIVQESKFVISPNKMRRKEMSAKSNKNKIKFNYNDKKSQMNYKNDENMSIDKMKYDKIRNVSSENVEIDKNDEMSTCKTDRINV